MARVVNESFGCDLKAHPNWRLAHEQWPRKGETFEEVVFYRSELAKGMLIPRLKSTGTQITPLRDAVLSQPLDDFSFVNLELIFQVEEK